MNALKLKGLKIKKNIKSKINTYKNKAWYSIQNSFENQVANATQCATNESTIY